MLKQVQCCSRTRQRLRREIQNTEKLQRGKGTLTKSLSKPKNMQLRQIHNVSPFQGGHRRRPPTKVKGEQDRQTCFLCLPKTHSVLRQKLVQYLCHPWHERRLDHGLVYARTTPNGAFAFHEAVGGWGPGKRDAGLQKTSFNCRKLIKDRGYLQLGLPSRPSLQERIDESKQNMRREIKGLGNKW